MPRHERSILAREIASVLLGLAAALFPQEQARADETPKPEAAPPSPVTDAPTGTPTDKPLNAPSDTPTEGAAQLPKVVVSAWRRREDPQRVPISIDAFTGDSLQREDIRTTTDVQNNVPGLAICCANGQANYNFIRGIQGVQAYFAETPLMAGNGSATSLSGNSMYFDLDSLSVLKGPQGTLFGMSTNGGALLFSPHRPADTFGGYVSAELGDYGRRIVEGVVNVPVNDMLKLRVGLQSTYVDGYVTDLTSGKKLGTDDYSIARLVVSFKPNASFDNDLLINRYDSNGTLAPYIPVAVNPNGPAASAIGTALADEVAEQNKLGYYKLVGSSLPAASENSYPVQQTNVSNITTLHLSDAVSLKNILGYERLYSFAVFDTDGTPFKIYDDNVAGSIPPAAHQLVSEELQLQGKALDGKLSYTTGLFYSGSHPGAPGKNVDDLSDVFGIQTFASASTRFKTEAVYAQGTYDLGASLKGLKATAGYRYTDDQRWLNKTSGTIIPADGNLLIPDAPLNLSSASKNGSYTLGLSYEASRQTMVYLTNSKGYLNGGFNTSVTQAADAPYGPESLNNFELGLKSDLNWGEMQARVNLAAYYGFYRDGQVSVTTLVNAGTPQQALAVLTKNAAQGLVRGLEWHLELIPNPSLELTFFGSYMADKYTSYQSLSSDGLPIDLSATPFVYVPKLKYGLSATAYWPVSECGGHLSTTFAFTHQDGVIGVSTLNPQWYDKSPAFGRLNISTDWDEVMGRKGLGASLFIDNALQNKDTNGSFGAYNSLGLLGYAQARPRMVGLRLKQVF